jgi:hypothetical protein
VVGDDVDQHPHPEPVRLGRHGRQAGHAAAGDRLVLEHRSTVVLREHHDVGGTDADPSVAASLAPTTEGPA